MRKLVIAVDGTAGSGKSDTFKQVANILDYIFIDTGLMYRAFTVLCIDQKIDFNNIDQVINLIDNFDYQISGDKVILNGLDITDRLHLTEVIKNINYITPIVQIRKMMTEKQRELALRNNQKGVIEIGRDITSIVLPDADLKIYLDSSVETRAKRRHKQNMANGITDMSYEEIKSAIDKRDKSDKNREIGPLVLTNDSWYINNSNLTIDQTVNLIVTKIKEAEGD